jgi:hypothetical protein
LQSITVIEAKSLGGGVVFAKITPWGKSVRGL